MYASLVDRGRHSNSTAGPHHESELLTKEQQSNQTHIAWLVLQLAGQVTLPILIITMLFHKKITRRNPTIINLCIVWTLATIPPELLFYAGKYKHHGPKPSPMLCLFQAATISGVPPMAAMAYLSVVVHACTVVYDIINANIIRPISFDYRLILLLSGPYVSFLVFALAVAIVGAQYPNDVIPYRFFCAVTRHNLGHPVFGFTILVVLATLVAQVWIAVMFYRNWLAKRRGNVSHRDVSAVDIQLLLRMVFFTIFEVIIIVSSVVTMMEPSLEAAKVLAATPPFAVFLIFASSPDILRAWFPCCFRRKSAKPLALPSSTSLNTSSPDDGNSVGPSHMRSVVSFREVQNRDWDIEKATAEMGPSLVPQRFSYDPRLTMTGATALVDPHAHLDAAPTSRSPSPRAGRSSPERI